MKNLKWYQKFIVMFIFIGLLSLFLYNMINNIEFWNVSVSSILSLIFVLYITFYLTQKINEQKEQYVHLENLLLDIVKIANEDRLFDTGDETRRQLAGILQRKLSNKITILKEYKLEGKTGEYVEKLEEKFEDVRELYGNHVNEPDFREKHETDIANYIEKIESYCDRIHHELYQ